VRMIVLVKAFVIKELVSVIQDGQDLIAPSRSALDNLVKIFALEMEFATLLVSIVFVALVGLRLIVQNDSAQMIVVIMEFVIMENALVCLDMLGMIAHKVLVLINAVDTEHVNPVFVSVLAVARDMIAQLPNAHRIALDLVNVPMVYVIVFPLTQETAAQSKDVQMTVLEMENAVI